MRCTAATVQPARPQSSRRYGLPSNVPGQSAKCVCLKLAHFPLFTRVRKADEFGLSFAQKCFASFCRVGMVAAPCMPFSLNVKVLLWERVYACAALMQGRKSENVVNQVAIAD